MQRLTFDLKFIFLAMSNACVLAWGTAALFYSEGTVAVPLTAVCTASLTSALYWMGPRRHPVVLGAIGGFVGAAAIALCFCTLHAIGYVFQDGPPDEYFDDGAFAELVVYPIGYVIVWGGLGSIFGLVCGVMVWGIRSPPPTNT